MTITVYEDVCLGLYVNQRGIGYKIHSLPKASSLFKKYFMRFLKYRDQKIAGKQVPDGEIN